MKKRLIGLDIYRLICMFLITTIHIIGYSDLSTSINYTHFNFYLINFIKAFQTFAISGFVLISAYFLISANTTIKKIISFWLQVVFYSIIILLISLAFSSDFSPVNILKSLFPIITNHYWYPVSYLLLLLFVPILNKIIYSLDKKEYSVLIILIFFVCAFFQLNPFFSADIYLGNESHGIIWFIFLYFISGYIKIHGLSRKLFGVFTFIISGLLLFVIILLKNNFLNLKESYKFISIILDKVNFTSDNSLIPLIFTISSFNIFATSKCLQRNSENKTFNFIVASAFGVYLIQEHCLVREILWSTVNISKWGQSPFLILIIFAVFIALLVVGVLIYGVYKLAKKLFINRTEKGILKLIEKLKASIQKR